MPLFYANILQPLIDVFDQVLRFIHDNLVPASWGLAIVGLTVLVRALLLPLTLKQVKSMQALQRLQPEIKALQAKHKDDKQRLNKEMMAFYQENKVNPFGSCLPLVAQFPVFISLFYLLRQDLKKHICGGPMTQAAHTAGQSFTHFANGHACGQVAGGKAHASFLFIPDITDHAVGGVLIALILLYVGSQLASGLLMSVTADRNQRLMMIGLPVFFTLFIINFPAGLIVYWITTNLWTIVQQYIVRRRHPPPPRPAPADDAGATGAGGFRALVDSLRGQASGDTNGAARGGSRGRELAPAAGRQAPAAPPPRPPRKKKKRSGRRR